MSKPEKTSMSAQIDKAVEYRSGADDSGVTEHSIVQQYIVKYGMIVFLVVGAVALAMGVALIVNLGRPQPKPELLATDAQGNVTKLVAVSRPNLSNTALFNWASEATGEIWTFNFANINERVGGFKKFFTDEGFESYLTMMKTLPWLSEVKEGKESVSAQVDGVPLIKKGPIEQMGYRLWVIEVPFLMKREAFGKQSETTRNVFKMVLVYDPSPRFEKGFAIQQMKLERR